METEKENN